MLSQKMLAMYPDIPKEIVKSYSNECVSLIETTRVPFDEFTYNDYHFVIPVHNAPPIIINGRSKPMKTGVIFPCNPGQPHRAEEMGTDRMDLFVLDLKRDFLQSAAEQLYPSGKIEFVNREFRYSNQIRELLRSFMEECRIAQPGGELARHSLSILLAVALLREGFHNLSCAGRIQKSYTDARSVEKAREYLTENIDRKLSLDELAGEMHYSAFHFLRLFKASTGMTPFEYLTEIKVERAKELLKSTGLSMLEISMQCGFGSSSHFAQVFKKKVGVSPTKYKKYI